jgi:nucleoside-diphosphate-sugar epimerase
MARVLITGAGGFTGTHLAAELSAHGFECVGVASHHQEALSAKFAQVHTANLLDPGRLADVVRQVQPQFVVHLAAIAFVAHGDAEQVYRTNVVGTRNLLEALTTLAAAPAMTILASSANIYGNADVDVITEDTPPAPANDYAVSKLSMEYMARLYSEKLPLTVVRPFNYTGRGQSESFLVPKIVAHARRKATGIELGNLDVARDFSDVRTVVRCYRQLLACPAAAGQTINICSGRVYTLKEILDLVQELSGHRLPVTVNPAFVRADEVKVLRGSNERLVSLIGDVHSIALAETLQWMLQGPS